MRMARSARGLAGAALLAALMTPVATTASAAPTGPAASRPVHRATAGPRERSFIFLVGYSHRYGIVYDDFGNGRRQVCTHRSFGALTARQQCLELRGAWQVAAVRAADVIYRPFHDSASVVMTVV